jgi:hypothetical protein
MLARKRLLDRLLVERDISSSSTGPRPITSPRLDDAVSGSSMRAVASLEAGAMSRTTIMAMTRSRQRLRGGPSMRSRPMLRSVPSTAATWPCGNARRTMMLS